MAMFVLPKRANFDDIIRHWKVYEEVLARTQLFTRHSVNDPTHKEVVAPAPWLVQLWLVDADCALYDSARTLSLVEPPSLHVPQNELLASITKLRQFSSEATAMLNGLTEAHPLIRTELNVKTHDSGQLILGLVNCAATLDFA
jgi:hypothetical protein